MTKDKLKKLNAVSVAVVLIFLVIYILVTYMIINSAYNETIFSNAPSYVIKIVGYTPTVVVFAALCLRIYCRYELKKRESDERITALEREIERLKK